MKKDKVEVQKGEIKVDKPSYRTMSYPNRVREREQEVMMRRDYQTLKYHTPKK
jgi:hypothetical protein